MTEPIVETIELDADESNELLFKVNIEGHVVGPAKVRLVCESDDMSYMFPGRPSDEQGLVQFVLHKTAGLKEGTYPARVEVLVENRYFVPVSFNIEVKKTVQVFAEAVSLPKPVKRDSDVRVSAVPVIVKPKKMPQPVVIEGPQRVQEKNTVVQPIVEKKSLSRPKTLADRYRVRKS